MTHAILNKLMGDPNARAVKRAMKWVEQVNAQEDAFKQLSDEQLLGKTVEFKERLAKGESLDKLLPEAFAAVREAAGRTIGQRHYNVQLDRKSVV